MGNKLFFPLARDWTCIEINAEYAKVLKASFPKAEVKVADSFTLLQDKSEHDLILADCPQGFYGKGQSYCEHFEFLPLLLETLYKRATLFLNVNLQPHNAIKNQVVGKDQYGMTNFGNWIERRHKFYGNKEERMSEQFVKEFYRAYLLNRGFTLDEFKIFLEPSKIIGHPPFIARCILLIEPIQEKHNPIGNNPAKQTIK